MPPPATPRPDLPRERLARAGPAALSDSELLAVLLCHGCRGEDVVALGGRVLSEAGSLSGLARWRLGDFRRWAAQNRPGDQENMTGRSLCFPIPLSELETNINLRTP